MDNTKAQGFPIVGIGASAGGLEALRELVSAIPADSGFCYVIVQHLSPDHASIMDQLLASHSEVPVHKIEDGMEAAADKVFVIPAGPTLTIEKGRFRLHEREKDKRIRTPIDEFLTSLAAECGRDAFCVILSGTGSDGTHGLRAIKSSGGFAIVQQSRSARFPGMPDSAAATGLVDLSLRPKDIPLRLIDIASHRGELFGIDDGEQVRAHIETALPEILRLIDEDQGHDFSQYKTGTLIRRIERRMSLLRLRSVEALIDRLDRKPSERRHLLQDFLIGVTEFFRDEHAFGVLYDKAILPLLDSDREKFRLWVPGCSTGEEVYSIAMLFSEELKERGDTRPWQVFGTDIDNAALSHARAGVYGETAISGIGAARKKRFFQRINGHFQISAELRERCVFAPHNLIQDPPFSRLDLVSCRNLLIYLTPEIQSTIIPRFHYALNRSGFLFLGPSESLGQREQFFHTVDRNARLFQRNDHQEHTYSSLTERWSEGQRRQTRINRQHFGPVPQAPSEPDFESQVTGFFLRETAPPFAVINDRDEVSFLSERMGAFLRPPTGVVSAVLDQFLARDLRMPVRAAISAVREGALKERIENIVVEEGGTTRLVDVEANPLPFAQGSVLVTLQPVRTQDGGALNDDRSQRSDAERDLIERELTLARQQLSSTLADYETTEQELRSSNEELLSMNEELQSSNEELETSREELQSMNEELETINAELTENNRQLTEANSDLRNLFESTDIATVFLDQNLCVRRFTPASQRLFGIQDRDIGRPINDLAWRVSYDALKEDAARVSETLQPVEREVVIPQTEETFLMRIRPYRRTDDRIDGCVLTFYDITDRKRYESQLAENAEVLARQYAELETLYDTTPVGLNLLDRDLRYIRINERLAEINGIPVEDHIGRKQGDVLPEIDAKVRETQLRVLATGEPSLGNEVQGTTPAEPGVVRDWVVDYYPVRQGDRVFAVGSCVGEVTDQKRLQRQVEESEAKLRRLFDQAPVMIAMHEGPEHRFIYTNPAHEMAVGKRNIDHAPLREAMPELEGQGIFERFDRAYEDGETVMTHEFEAAVTDPDTGEARTGWYTQILEPWFNGKGHVGGLMSFAFDVSEVVRARKEAEASRERLAESEQRLSRAVNAGELGVVDLDPEAETIILDKRAQEIFGIHEDTPIPLQQIFDIVHPDDREELEAEVARNLDPGGSPQHRISYRVRRPSDGTLIWIEASGDVFFNGGRATRLLGVVRDVTARREAEARQELLLQELQHRVKNTMAIILAIVNFSSRNAQDVTSFTETLHARLHAIARTHDLLTKTDWRGGGLRELVQRELEPFSPEIEGRFELEGSDLQLGTKQTLALALALHELATNAVKYGALSNGDGRVRITLDRVGGERGRLVWEETGGPALASPPLKEGFGTFLLQRALAEDIKGTADLEFRESGVRCVLEFPVNEGSAKRHG